jgi:S1-C subfamily serine protease
VAARSVTRLAELRRELAHRYAGDRLPLTLQRNGKQLDVEADLVAEVKPSPPSR